MIRDYSKIKQRSPLDGVLCKNNDQFLENPACAEL